MKVQDADAPRTSVGVTRTAAAERASSVTKTTVRDGAPEVRSRKPMRIYPCGKATAVRMSLDVFNSITAVPRAGLMTYIRNLPRIHEREEKLTDFEAKLERAISQDSTP